MSHYKKNIFHTHMSIYTMEDAGYLNETITHKYKQEHLYIINIIPFSPFNFLCYIVWFLYVVSFIFTLHGTELTLLTFHLQCRLCF